MVVPYFLHLPRSHNETRDRFTSITCFISLFYFLKPDENCSAMQVLEDMHKCLDIPELSYVDDTMGLFIMLPRAMGSSSKATHKLSKATTSWRPGKLLPATPLPEVGNPPLKSIRICHQKCKCKSGLSHVLCCNLLNFLRTEESKMSFEILIS